MTNVTIKPGITIDCRGLNADEKETIARRLDEVVNQLGGRSYARPVRDFTIIDGESDSNSISDSFYDLDETVQRFIEYYPRYYGAEPYVVDAEELLREE